MKNYKKKFFKLVKDRLKSNSRDTDLISQLNELKERNKYLNTVNHVLKRDLDMLFSFTNTNPKLLEHVIYRHKMSIEKDTLIINLPNGKLKIKNDRVSFEDNSADDFKELGGRLQRSLNI